MFRPFDDFGNASRMNQDKKTAGRRADRLIVGLSGASGIIYGVRLLEVLRATGIEVHLVMSKTAEITLAHETDYKVAQVKALASVVHSNADLGAAISSGSFKTRGMIIAPCSIRTASEIACGVTSTLMSRAADVALKERRHVVLMVRESPLHTGHLRTLTHLSEIGAVIAPPLPAFYTRPSTIEDIVDQTVGRVLDLFDIDAGTVKRWRDPDSKQKRKK
jgi:4-hydroxy-3-polyprenylbenzoate decarboxylase